jgi:hypothetical protein
MLHPPIRFQALAFLAGVAMLGISAIASADPPSRVARLGYATGAVSLSPGGENDWVQATVNRPLTTGDRLWTDARARAEIQVGGAMIRMNAFTSVSILNLDDQIAQLQLTQGTLNVRVRRLDANQLFEVDTPNLAFTLRQAGEYRIEVDADGNATTIVVRNGRGEAYGDGAAYAIDSRQPYRFTGTGLREYEYLEPARLDEFDTWTSERDRRYDNSPSARYVSQDVVGYEDLDQNGTWRTDATYGSIWFPNRVAAGWAPYRDGHWAWVDPWGWTWMDDAPWGYAVSHYGRWTNQRGTWGWVPGPVRSRAYYAPALVAFVGGDNFQLRISSGNVGGVAWFPLAPREVYRPSYAVSRGYFENINRSNTVVNTTVINNYYNNSNVTNVVYANRQVAGAVIAMPATAFVQSQQVSKAAVQVTREMIASAPVALVPRVAPTERSVRGAATQGGTPPGRVFERPVVARTAPPAAHAGFAAQQQQLNTKPGIPLDTAARQALKPAASVPAPVVKVVVPPQIAPPTALPPRIAPNARNTPNAPNATSGKGGNGPGKADERKAPVAPAAPTVAPAAAPTAAPQVTPPAPVAPPPESRGKPDQRGMGEPRAQPVVPPPPPPATAQGAAPARVAPQVTNPPTPAVPPPEPRERADQRGKSEQRPEPVVAPRVQSPPPAQVEPPPVVLPPSPSQSPDQRGKVEPRAQPVAPPPPVQRPAPVQAAPTQPTPPLSPTQGPEQRGRSEPRGQPVAPPPQRAVEPKDVPSQAAPPTRAAQPPTQRARPEPVPTAKQGEPPQPVMAPNLLSRPAPQGQAAPRAEPRAQEPRPAAGKAEDKKSKEEQKRDEENRKQKE